MLDNIKHSIFPNFIGICLIFGGWFISILNVGLARFEPNVLFTKWTLSGLIMIMIGAYLPRIWSAISNRKK